MPFLVCQKFRSSRIVAFSTGNVYGLTSVARGGSRESDPLNAGRRLRHELRRPRAGLRICEPNVRDSDGDPAFELRRRDALRRAGRWPQKVWARQPIDVTMGHFNAIWQADANAMALSAFAHLAMPPTLLNIAGQEILSVRRVAEEFGQRFGKAVRFEGTESGDAFLSNAAMSHRLLGPPASMRPR